MSAFVVFSSMGFYPVIPGFPYYTIGSPVFEKITLHLSGGKIFVISAPGCSETNKYVEEAYLNGKPLHIPWFSHADLMQGGELKLIMGPKPGKLWNNAIENLSIINPMSEK
jgi:putative alpha-1,2-mannosidase